MAQIEIYTGHFGSGKTEVVLNRALAYAGQGETVHLVDLDIVKPYFRSREVRHFLKESGINLITPGGELENADLPVISPKVLGALSSAQGKILFDVGGDPMGATVLGAFAQLIGRQGYEMFFVLNPYRPFTKDIPMVTKMLRDIEAASRLKVCGIISNPNLGRGTLLEDLLLGLPVVKEMAEVLGLPISLTTITERYADLLVSELDGLIQTVKNFLLPPWELEEGQVFKMDPSLTLSHIRRGIEC
ncbi:hypothetical protein E4K67_13845 [Desulfosporosinus fructosivorans]|uniref:CobQ/CobB/MinD/ParA nucleotide binding domain-containing protein n=1 Tax=Desulfosporosinus fructosivorans TaxID=2018669 RepID=A0A4Z0R5R7_9FIRM|nr:hypothetical protein [Desulfosporosinus fructosivorans]TGE37789.1 hypothetical protein E4K67_13845 [Desulfosporosinus fructosivorans]